MSILYRKTFFQREIFFSFFSYFCFLGHYYKNDVFIDLKLGDFFVFRERRVKELKGHPIVWIRSGYEYSGVLLNCWVRAQNWYPGEIEYRI